MNGAVIGKGSIVGSNALVAEGKSFPDGVLILGSPGKIVRELRPEEIEGIRGIADGYVERARRFKAELSSPTNAKARRTAVYFGAIRMAPSSLITSPFSIAFSAMCFTSAAYSDGWPSRDGNGTWAPSESCTSFGSECSIGVRKIPGAIVHTRMPLRARSRAIGSVIPTTPPFEAE